MSVACPACLSTVTRPLFSVNAEESAQLQVIREGPYRERHDALVRLIRKKWKGDHCEIRSCRDCGFGFASPFVAGDAEFYNLAYPTVRYPKKKWEFSKTLDVLRQMDTSGKRALDVASGEGFFLDLCVPEIFSLEDVMATEFSDDSASVLRSKGYRASSADLRSPEFDAMHETFDFIFLFQVVEHMDEIDELFKRLSQLTKPAGSIFIAVPNSKWVAYREQTGSLMDLPPTHIGRWTPQAFGAVASRNGLALTAHEVEPFSAPSFILDDIIFSHFARSMRVGTVANKARSLSSRLFRLLGEAAEAVTFAPSRARALSRAIRQREQMGGPALWVQLRNTKS